ncbi:MAG: hypothetical protein QM627_02280 [Luteolibacter sp.]
MFCSWKTRPDAPCSCAYQLRSPVHELLNHLCCLGKGTLVLRRPGISFAKSTSFGLHITDRASDWKLLRDSISGLETDLGRELRVYLLRELSEPRPIFAMGPPGKPVELSIRLDGLTWQAPAIQQMIQRFDGISLDCVESHRLGAGAWLDEWEQPRPADEKVPADLIEDARENLHRCQSLHVAIRTDTHRSTMHFRPSFIDSEGSVLRIADKQRHHIVYADVSARDFSLSNLGNRQLFLTHV